MIKDTLNLPKTTFSMKANLVQREPLLLKEWKKDNIYARIRKNRRGRKKFVLHDGPPYANGQIHMGHVLNKILKDVVVKFNTMKGYDSPFIPGWDCHGLPVEHQLFKELGISKHDIDHVEFRKKARDYALKFVEVQKGEFERLGIFGDWERPYLTLDPKYEAAVVRSFGGLVKRGYVYKDLKPVNWCTGCETALAEAEVEYEDRTSPAIYVKFECASEGASFVIWTTTPWTLLGNVAIAVHPDMTYVIIDVNGENLIMLDSLANKIMKKLKKPYKLLKKVKGKELEGAECAHPFIDRISKVVLAYYISSEEGTGCVHTAPGHGQEDYITGKKYNLPMIMPVDQKGVFDNTCGEFSGMEVFAANPKIVERLKNDGTQLISEKITHSYPHCWRCKKPIIFRATEQYFVRIDHKDLRNKMLSFTKDDVKWYPGSGEARISSMVENRPDWCLSRQRHWGVPIIAFKCIKCDEILLDHLVIEHVAKIIEKEGCDVWFVKSAPDLLPKGACCNKCKSQELAKETDIIDVWFESGASFSSVLKGNNELDFPSDLYLEGSDQHRGWFQSSLIISAALEGSPPYKNVLTHGFVVDANGKKMSKSIGNVISPQNVMKKYGADILRLWVISSNYQEDVRLSEEILDRLADAYRKMRNTLRFLLGNINDFDPSKDRVPSEELVEIDRWMLSRLAGLIEEAEKNYAGYAFYKIYRSVYNFCVYEISSLYLDILKDRLYTFGKNSHERRSGQTVMYEIFLALVKLLAPILSFTAEEAWKSIFSYKETIHASVWHWDENTLLKWKDASLDEKWSGLLEIRAEVLKALESKRSSNEIGSSLEACVSLYSDKKEFTELLRNNADCLPALFISSEVEITGSRLRESVKCANLPLHIAIGKAKGRKCVRCWNFREDVQSNKELGDICARCAKVIRERR